jgi:hypothetical protein
MFGTVVYSLRACENCWDSMSIPTLQVFINLSRYEHLGCVWDCDFVEKKVQF